MIRTTVFAAVIAATALPAFAAEQQARLTDDVGSRVAAAQTAWSTKLQLNTDQRDRASVQDALRMAATEAARGNQASAASYLSVVEARLSR